ncbi:MAG: DUF5348 domain-containing protein [Lachnospiraceae bacterium]|uniref:DUF5348 domain-containing protein n=1 Tax=uncultured Lactobacillus sp. TaxID=153152 RepID=UPI0023D54266|nr:DUF5348 domain-containing protein [uncultured Lactobacillus sp.]MDE6994892.1 DUF5348 domain-containing protein [Lachnospiraceae bacterium]
MGDLKALSEEMAKLQKQINTLFRISDYPDCDDMSGLSDYKQIKTADQRQQLEEYRDILYRLIDIKRILDYYDYPVGRTGTLHLNSQGRYETESGYYYTSGSAIEFLRTEEVWNYDSDKWEDAEIWTTSRVESKNGKYYIVGYPDLDMAGLKVRIRR